MTAAELDFTVKRGDFSLAVSIEVPDGQRVGVVGPNGSGKSTMLSAVAGHLPISSGRILLRDVPMDVHGERRFWVPPHRRGVGWIGPGGLVFGHLSVEDNVAYGLRAVKSPDIGPTTARMLERFDLAGLAGRRASSLSTGEQARVALARTFAVSPSILLLDEPFDGLDPEAATHLRGLVDEMAASTCLFMASHSLPDLAALTDRVVCLDRGVVVADGPIREVLSAPKNPFLAELAGLDAVEARRRLGLDSSS